MKNERAVCDRNSDLKGNLLVWITSKQLKLHQKHKMALIQYCLSATWRLSFLSHFWAEKSPSLMNGARFCIQICRNDGLILDLHCRQKNFHLRKCCIFPVFDPRNSLFGETVSQAFSETWRKHLGLTADHIRMDGGISWDPFHANTHIESSLGSHPFL